MQENIDLVQRGFRLLLGSLSGYIGQELHGQYGNGWWTNVLYTLDDQRRDLPLDGTYGDLVDSLDIANCIRLINRKWRDTFEQKLPIDCRTYANELMGVRNIVSHIGQQDLDQRTSERALDTMYRLCNEIDPENADEIYNLYQEIRARAADIQPPVYMGLPQPVSESGRRTPDEHNILLIDNKEIIEKTALTKKVVFGGKTVVYPVYRVHLDYLFYNDQNDRIATWISRYEAENGQGSLYSLDFEIYNRIIEGFICDSNQDAINKTKKNIDMVGQREPGVALADGRIVDGNRRFTCLRQLQRETSEPLYFETVIMDMDIHEDKKQIKLLELAIQHGEESKVDYDLIDYAIGTYRDVVLTNLLTVEEYAESANEKPADVKKRIEVAKVISEFLEYLKLPEQYHVAREYQVYSLFQEMMAPLNKLKKKEEKEQLKKIAFTNAMMAAIPDQRKFIRDIKGLVGNANYENYFADQKQIQDKIQEKYAEASIRSKEDVDKFAEEHAALKEELQYSMERALAKARNIQLKNKPGETVSRCFNSLMDVDTRLFAKLNPEEKAELFGNLEELIKVCENMKRYLG